MINHTHVEKHWTDVRSCNYKSFVAQRLEAHVFFLNNTKLNTWHYKTPSDFHMWTLTFALLRKFLKIYFQFCVYVTVGVECAYECRCPQMPDALDPPGNMYVFERLQM